MTDYKYLNNVREMQFSDEKEFKTTQQAMTYCGFNPQKQSFIFDMLSAVLEVGNIEFSGTGAATITKLSQKSIDIVESLLKLKKTSLSKVLLQKAVGTARGKTTTVEAKIEDAINSR